MPKEAKPDDVPLHEETDSPTYADDHNFYKVEKWTRDGTKVDSLLYAGNSLGRARAVFERSIKHRPRIRLTIRQRRGCSINGRRLTRDEWIAKLPVLLRARDRKAVPETRPLNSFIPFRP